MRKTLLICLAAALAAAETGNGAQTPLGWRILAGDETGVTVEFHAAPPVVHPSADGFADIFVRGYTRERVEGRPVLPVRRFLVEVPRDRAVSLESEQSAITTVEGAVPLVWKRDGGRDGADSRELLDSAARGDRSGFADLVSVETMRGRRVALVDVRPVLWDRSARSLVHAGRIVVRLSWRPAVRPERPAAPRPEDRFIIGAGAWSAGADPDRASLRQRSPFEFALSDTWLRLSVTGGGLYRVRYEDLVRAGVDPGSIDPATVRLFTGGPLQQPDSVGNGGSYEQEWRLTELAVIYDGSDTGAMMPGESFLFYGVPAAGWRNAIDRSAREDMWYKHRYDTEAVCWMTWGGSFAGAPLRMSGRDVAPSGDPDLNVTTYRHRLHVESDLQYDPVHTDDFWYWRRLNAGTTYFTHDFQCSDVAGGAGSVRTVGYGPVIIGNAVGEADCAVNGEPAGHIEWVAYSFYRPDTLDAALSSIRSGANTFTLTKPSEDVMYVQWYEIAYDRYLRSDGGRLDFFSPAAAGAVSFSMGRFPEAEDLVLIDATDWTAPVLLTGWAATVAGGSLDVEFEDALD
ncbi:MAG: hypothetical protein PHQ19_04445, partial [Candidatus Krumholzibacteria bacterium]|nr:hypothetical protein [Candidatus Krumholzibacteria bacterium]